MSGRPDAVERLRSLLEGRGVPYDAPTEFATAWKDPDGHPVDSICTAGRVFVSHVATPERAVEVTLGRGTCHDFGGQEGTNGEGYDFACDACGFCCDICQPNYCPNCGARMEDEP